ncbi:MAG: ATP/GTP-binding protein [Rhodocyclaceae bacterium]|nr:ATP/GTP-binding protein [Rhodocyclaceae bacterium]
MHASKHHKIVFAGPVGAGKTTAIEALSDIEPVRTEANPTDEVAKLKNNTTVALDYGVLNLGNGEKIMLYGTPGQSRFSFMWDIVTEGGIGLVLLINNRRPDPLHDLREFMKAFDRFVRRTACVIGITHCDGARTPDLADYRKALADLRLPSPVPVFQVDARRSADIAAMVKALLFTLDPMQQDA